MTTPAIAKIEPPDRSMPAVMITKVMPTAMMALMEVCNAMFKKLETVKK